MLKTFFIFYLVVSFNVYSEHWQKEENQVLAAAKWANRPIVAIFSKMQGCPWSQKLREEILGNPCFSQKIGCVAILWQVDLSQMEEDKELREKYHVDISPLILLLDPRGKEFARLEYVPLNADEYASEINKLIDHFQEICLVLDNDELTFDEEKWQDLYLKAKQFSVPCFKQILLERGIQYEKGTFFHFEKFMSLLEKYKLKHPLVRKFKEQLLDLDPENRLGLHFKVAVLEFNKILSRLKPKDRPEKPLKPLLRFIHQFGKTDQENVWKAELMVSEYLFTKNFIDQALEYAEAAYEDAPDFAKPKIVETIGFMKNGL